MTTNQLIDHLARLVADNPEAGDANVVVRIGNYSEGIEHLEFSLAKSETWPFDCNVIQLSANKLNPYAYDSKTEAPGFKSE